MSVEAVRALVHRKLGIVEQADDAQMKEAGATDEVAQDATVKILATEAHEIEWFEATTNGETVGKEATVGDDQAKLTEATSPTG